MARALPGALLAARDAVLCAVGPQRGLCFRQTTNAAEAKTLGVCLLPRLPGTSLLPPGEVGLAGVGKATLRPSCGFPSSRGPADFERGAQFCTAWTVAGIYRCDSARPPAQKRSGGPPQSKHFRESGECWAPHTEHRCRRRRRRRRRTRAGASRTWSSSSCSSTAPRSRRSSRTSSGGTGAARTRRRRASRRCSRRRRQRPGAPQHQPPHRHAGRPSRRRSPCRKI